MPVTTFQEVVHALATVPADGQRGLRFCFGREVNDRTGLFLAWPEVAARVRGLALRLRAAGVDGGTVVAVHCHDQQAALFAILAAIHLGAVPTALSPVGAGTPERLLAQLHAVLAVARPRVLVLDRELPPEALTVPLPPTLLINELPAADACEPAHTALPDDPCFLQFTSGSTSTPKGVVVTHRMLLANLDAITATLAWGAHGRTVGWLPIYHDMSLVGMYGMVVRHAARGCFFPATRFGRNPELWLELLAEEHADGSAGPNFAYAMLVRLAERRPPKVDLSRVRGFICGSEPISADTMRRFAALTTPLGLAQPMIPAYGMAECTLMATSTRPGDPLRTLIVERRALEQRGRVVDHDPAGLIAESGPSLAIELVSCGAVAAGITLRIAGTDGDDQIGEVLLAGDAVLSRYWQAPEATAAAFVELDGRRWLRTGDLGFVRAGQLYVCGRAKDVIIHHGVNYYPADVEFALQQALPDQVRMAAVVDLRTTLAEDFRGLGVAFEEGKKAGDGGAVERAVSEFVHRYTGLPVAVCRSLRGGEHLPRTTSGKLMRPAIRALLSE